MTGNDRLRASAAFPDTKPHYELLDALRGVAALLVVWYHVHEGFASAGGGLVTGINHGYLAVDFFFMLSGFVLSYAYDERLRWNKLTLRGFFRRRLIRLHPMVVLGAVVGAVTFLLQGSVRWDGTHVATSTVMLALLLAMFMIPAVPGQARDVRGNGEMFPLNGPSWSLFSEYVGNILYALAIRRLPTKALRILTVMLAVALAGFAVLDVSGYGNIGVGWTLDAVNFFGGLLRMLFPFCAGMLIARDFRPAKVRGAMWICSAVLIALFFVPYINGSVTVGLGNGLVAQVLGRERLALSLNGLHEAFCVIAVFPAVVWLGASGNAGGGLGGRLCKWLGDISYPLYITHYPFMYLFYAWLIRRQAFTLAETWQVAVPLCLWCVLFAWACLKLYDEPVRRRLSAK